ncbi:MAG: alpha-glucan phosphorylase [Clostridia bacterium]|nr:MAG: alpha-glucan phosphorylase [Clostridia bacterium]
MKLLGSLSVFPTIPQRLQGLNDLIYNLWWSWSPQAQTLFQTIDPIRWEETNHNPVKLLRFISPERMALLANDADFLQMFDAVMADLHAYMHPESTWFSRNHAANKDDLIAYFSAEFGLHESLPIYSGGLGILSGDHCKSASDLGLPFVGVGFLYPQGYFTQHIADDGTQEAIYEKIDFSEEPVTAATDADGKEILISVELPGRNVYAKVWRIQVGRIPLYLLDTDVEQNAEQDRVLAARLYGGDQEVRIAQEIMLGIGGVRALRALKLHPTIFHMNEGHSSFLSLERTRELIKEQHLSFFEAQQVIMASSVFTTHTPVAAGNDAFPFDLVDKYFRTYWGQIGLDRTGFMNLARWQTPWGERFSMTVLALRFAAYANGVSKLHGVVARKMWKNLWPGLPAEEVPITSITNGVHTGTWLSEDMGRLYDDYLKAANWREEPDLPEAWTHIDDIPDAVLWEKHRELRHRAIDFLSDRVARQRRRYGESPASIEEAYKLFNPDAFTIGFARRFATYKRASLIFRDIERIKRILNDPDHPVQIIFSGKAHPADEPGKAIIKQIHQLSKEPGFYGKIIFIENYDMNIARRMVQCVDLWLNNPRRPNEASGTSGQKAALNAIPNFSVRDGWWAEGYTGENGWVIGDERAYKDEETQDEADAQTLYNTLEKEILPAYFNIDEEGTPQAWIKRMKASVQYCAPRFSMSRQVKDYMEQLYLPAIKANKKMSADDFAAARSLARWKENIYRSWGQVRISADAPTIQHLSIGDCIDLSAQVVLGSLSPDDVSVEIVWGWRDGDEDLRNIHIQPMTLSRALPNGQFSYTGKLCFDENGKFGYAIRVLPLHSFLNNRYEMAAIKWA